MSFLKHLLIEEDGQDMVEYGLVLGAVVAAGIVAFSGFGKPITDGYSYIIDQIKTAL